MYAHAYSRGHGRVGEVHVLKHHFYAFAFKQRTQCESPVERVYGYGDVSCHVCMSAERE